MLKGILSVFAFLLFLSFVPLQLVAQNSAVIGAGYLAPAPVSAAPGQILTVYATGLGVTGAAHAGAGALPTSLGGVTATLRQGGVERPVPIVDVRPVFTCPDLVSVAGQTPCATLTAVTVQIPYELIPSCPLCPRAASLIGQLLVSTSSQTAAPIELSSLSDQIHVLTNCDLMLTPPVTLPASNGPGLGCASIVTHADGSLVSASAPASVGETVTAWAVGLGQTDPAAITGKPAAVAAPTVQKFALGFNYTVNALAAKPFAGRPDVKPPQPIFAGAAQGFAGLYQVNFVVPDEPPNGTPRCVIGTFAAGGNFVQSNLTVSIGSSFSFDGAAICVATRIPID